MTKTAKNHPFPGEFSDFLDTCLWSSCRYFIGRHTIAAACHAPDIARFLIKYPDAIPEGRKKQLALDIRREINDRIRWVGGVSVTSPDGREGQEDAATLWFRAIEKAWENQSEPINPFDYQWDIYIPQQEARCVGPKKDSSVAWFSLHELVTDLTPWIKLAGFLDPTHIIRLRGANGEEKEVDGFYYPVLDWYQDKKKIHMRLCTLEAYKNNPSIQVYIDEKAIASVKKIQAPGL